MTDEECFDLLREMVNSARQGWNNRYVVAKKKIRKAVKEDAGARHFFRTVFKTMDSLFMPKNSIPMKELFKGVKQ